MHIGIDVGGTNTDAVLMDDTRTLAAVKHATTPDVTSGIVQAIGELRAGHHFDGEQISAVMIGTTHFINALVQAKGLAPTAALRGGEEVPLHHRWAHQGGNRRSGHPVDVEACWRNFAQARPKLTFYFTTGSVSLRRTGPVFLSC